MHSIPWQLELFFTALEYWPLTLLAVALLFAALVWAFRRWRRRTVPCWCVVTDNGFPVFWTSAGLPYALQALRKWRTAAGSTGGVVREVRLTPAKLRAREGWAVNL